MDCLRIHAGDWDVASINDIATKGPQNGLYKSQDNYGSGFEMVHMQDLFANGIIANNKMQKVRVTDKELRTYQIQLGDILFARRSIAVAGSGQSSIVGCVTAPMTFESSIIRVSFDKQKAEPKFIYYYLASPLGRHEMFSITRTVTISGITGSDLKNYKVPLPTLHEQKQVVRTIEMWDQAIELTERLIAAKQERRKWLMQQLLTGKQQLLGFSGGDKWSYPKIGELAEDVSLKNGNGIDRPVLSCTKHRGLVDSLAYFGKQVFSKDLSTYKIVKRGQFAYATNHIDEGSIGYQNLYDEALISPMYTVFQTTNVIDDRFLYMVLKTETYRVIFASRTSASVDRRGSLRWKDFSKIRVPFPSIKEQRAIVSVLNIADRELELLSAQLDALREQKRGLMQQLLTGKKRVKVSPAEAIAEEQS